MWRSNRELRREKTWTRINLVPLLQAETDRDLVRRLEAAKKREANLMEGVEGWNPLDLKAPTPGVGKGGKRDSTQAEPVYHTDRYVNPTYLFMPWDSDARMESQWWRGTKMFLRVSSKYLIRKRHLCSPHMHLQEPAVPRTSRLYERASVGGTMMD